MKKFVYSVINDRQGHKTKLNKLFSGFIVCLILLSTCEVILESYEDINAVFLKEFRIFELFSIVVFSIEYLARIWTADLKYPTRGKIVARFAYIFSAMGLLDLLAILPFYLPLLFKFDLRFIRILSISRLLRIFKMNRYVKSMNLIWTVFRQKKMELLNTLFISVILILISSTIMYHLENEVQPDKFPDIVSTFWWSIATLTTIGYGDVFPVTGWGKLISGIIAVLGIGLIALPTGILSAAFMTEMENQNKLQKKLEKISKGHIKEKYAFCPHCGKKLPH